MKAIKGLMVKDLLILKSYAKNIILCIAFLAVCGFFNDTFSIFSIYIPIILGMMASNTLAYDGNSNAERYILATTTNKKDIVLSKYIFVFICIVVGAVLGLGVSFLLETIKGGLSTETIDIIISTEVGSIFGIMLVEIFQLPIIYKYGYEKGKYIQMIAIIVIILGAYTIYSNGVSVVEKLPINEIVELLKHYGLYILGVVTTILYILSYFISYKIYKKKEV